MNGGGGPPVFSEGSEPGRCHIVQLWPQLTQYDIFEPGFWNHGPEGTWYTLLEGNNFSGIYFDDCHGSTSDTTIFRNDLTGISQHGINSGWFSVPLAIMAQNRYVNIVANLLGFPGFSARYQVPNESSVGKDRKFQLGLPARIPEQPLQRHFLRPTGLDHDD